MPVAALLPPRLVRLLHAEQGGPPLGGHDQVGLIHVQGDHGGLTLLFVDFDLVCYSLLPILLGQLKMGERWHFKWADWRNS